MSAPPAMPAVSGDPAGVASHHLADHHPVVRLGGGVEAVDGLGRDGHRRVEPERVVGPARSLSIVLGTPTTGAHARRTGGRPRQACPRRRSPPARPAVPGPASTRSSSPVDAERVGAGGSEDGSAAGQDPRDVALAELGRSPLEQARASRAGRRSPRVPAIERPPADRADHRVQPRAVAATGQHPDSHPPRTLPRGALDGLPQVGEGRPPRTGRVPITQMG